MKIGEGRDVYDWYGMHGEKIPPPDAVVYYPDGSFLPMMFHYAAETCVPRDIAKEHGFDLMQTSMCDVLCDDSPLCLRYADGDGNVVREWSPPLVDGWLLVGKHDTEDGPAAIYVRKTE